MKAQINGITIEGTPEEIVKYQELIANKTKHNYFDKFKGVSPLDIKDIIEDVTRQTKKKPVVFGYPQIIENFEDNTKLTAGEIILMKEQIKELQEKISNEKEFFKKGIFNITVNTLKKDDAEEFKKRIKEEIEKINIKFNHKN